MYKTVDIDQLFQEITIIHHDIPQAFNIIKNLRWDRRVSKRELKSLENLIEISSDKEIISKRETDRAFQIIDGAFENPKIERDDQYALEILIRKLRQSIRAELIDLDNRSKEFINFLPESWRNEMDDCSKLLLKGIEDHYFDRLDTLSKTILEVLIENNYAMIIADLIEPVEERIGRKPDYHEIWESVDNMDINGLVDTIGGRRERKRDRFVFPRVAMESIRNKRDGKEELITGSISRNVTDLLDRTKARLFMNVYEFNSLLSPSVFVVSKYSLHRQYQNTIVRSIGTFYKGDLETHLLERYNIGLKGIDRKISDGDSLIAYGHFRPSGEQIWHDETLDRARNIGRAISTSRVVDIAR
ncbi:MAG: hypothetical protein U9N61_04515 [Euryarchaeota archaeon]|nr:hypothetical protein [Euryarchaeota archaeon]